MSEENRLSNFVPNLSELERDYLDKEYPSLMSDLRKLAKRLQKFGNYNSVFGSGKTCEIVFENFHPSDEKK